MNKVTTVLLKSFIVNTVLVFIKFIIGFIGKSNALLADGVHSLSDLATDVVAMVGSKLSDKPADKEHPYGHGRLEYVTSIIIGIVILVLGLALVFNSGSNEIPSIIVVYASIVTIVVKFFIAKYLCVMGGKMNNQILISSGKESSMDVISSIVVLISSFLIQFSDKISIFKYTDMISTILIGLFIIKTGISILRLNINLILGEVEADENYLSDVKNIIKSVSGVKLIDNIDIIKFGSYNEAKIQISVNEDTSLIDAHSIAHQVEDKLKSKSELKIKYVIIHINPIKNS